MRTLIKHIKAGLVVLMIGLVALGGVSGAAAAEKVPTQRANVSVVVKPTAKDGNIIYEITAKNVGKSPAQNTVITVPYDSSKLRLENVQFSGANAWVTDTRAGSFSAEILLLSSGGDWQTMTVYFTALGVFQPGNVVGDRLSYRWNDKQGSTSALSNLPILGDNTGMFALNASPASATAKTTRVFTSGEIFTPDELVTMWYTTPTGKSIELEVKGARLVDANSTKSKDNGGAFVSADVNGAIKVQYSTESLPPGKYTMVARGNSTGFVANAIFEVK